MEIYRKEPKRKHRDKKKLVHWLSLGIVASFLVAGLVYLLLQIDFASPARQANNIELNSLPRYYEGSITWQNQQGQKVEHCIVRLGLNGLRKNSETINFSFEAKIASVNQKIENQGIINLATNTIDLKELGKGSIEKVSDGNFNIILSKNQILHNYTK